MATYAEKLKHPEWQKMRLLIFKRDGFRCVRCGVTTLELHVHHKRYLKVSNPWDYPANLLETLCCICHKNEHNIERKPLPEPEYERKYEHLIIKKETPEVFKIINEQLNTLQNKLSENIDSELMDEILKNIMFLTNKKKELQGA